MLGEVRGLILMFVVVYHYLPMNPAPGGWGELILGFSGVFICNLTLILESLWERRRIKESAALQEDSEKRQDNWICVELEQDADKGWKVKSLSHAQY